MRLHIAGKMLLFVVEGKAQYSGFIPPAAGEWESRGWQVIEKSGDREDGVWRCAMCKWLYKENEEGTPFEELPDSWKCPLCGAPKADFERIG